MPTVEQHMHELMRKREPRRFRRHDYRFFQQLASRLAYPFNQWRRYDEARQDLMKAQLERIAGTEGLSQNCLEIVGRALNG